MLPEQINSLKFVVLDRLTPVESWRRMDACVMGGTVTNDSRLPQCHDNTRVAVIIAAKSLLAKTEVCTRNVLFCGYFAEEGTGR